MNQLFENLKKSPAILFGIGMLVVLGAAAILRSNQISELSDLESQLNTKLDKISLNAKHSENIDQDTQKLRELVKTIDERLFIADERSTNIDFFYSFEDKLDVVISQVDQMERGNVRFSKNGPDNLERYSVINYQIKISGSFYEILSFLYEIHQIDHIMRVSDFQVDATPSNAEKAGILSAEILVAVLATK